MRRRWYYWKQNLRANRPFFALTAGILVGAAILLNFRETIGGAAWEWFRIYGVQTAGRVMEQWFPPSIKEENGAFGLLGEKPILFSFLEEMAWNPENGEDPAYEKMLVRKWEEERSRKKESEIAMETMGALQDGESRETGKPGSGKHEAGNQETGNQTARNEELEMEPVGEVIARKPAGQGIIREKLADYDYMMKNFYSVHPTTTAGRDLMNAGDFLSMDLSLEADDEKPQILIYHTHSQEEFSDYPENPSATIVGVGAYLAELLEAKGYQVIHDTSVYDFKDGKLDRSQAYTYALEGITGILQKYPSIEVVLDIHRDGVAEGTRLVTEVNGKSTARIMFFNGTSQTPDGPIEYLPNPNRDANLAFSFQMQLKAAEQYPGFTRKIYLKGLRYNQHVRARAALIEVGAQTNTYEEAKNAMEPLSELLCGVLKGEDQ